jgi:lipoate-protein ligase A
VAAAWEIDERREPPSALHDSWPAVERDPDRRRVSVCRPTRRAVVLGSTQRLSVVDAEAAKAARLDVVRRRSGGGAVLVLPDDPVWIDAWIPVDDPLWCADVTGAFAWLGSTWSQALVRLGVADVDVQGGSAGACTRWSSLVCFGGVGAAEVTVAGRKVVGLAQRRNRRGAWFHSACVLRWDPTLLLEVLDLSPGERAAAAAGLGPAATGVAEVLARRPPGDGPGRSDRDDRDDVVSAVLDALP